MVSLTFEAGARQRQARWSYDAQLRHVTPRDDESRWLTDDNAVEPGTRQPRLTTVGGTSLRRDQNGGELPPRDRVYDVEADGGVRPTADPRPAAAANATVDLLDSLRERRGRRQRITDPELAGGTLDPMDAALHGGTSSRASGWDPPPEPPAAHPPDSQPDLAVDAEVLVLADVEGSPTFSSEDAEEDSDQPQAPTTSDQGSSGQGQPSVDVAGQERTQSRRARRASVPKWDDIVFGSRRE
jgi:hypothetical protein